MIFSIKYSMKIMITGATGFLGRNLVRAFPNDELVLTALAPELFDTVQTGESWFQNHKIYHADINENIDVLKDKLQGVDVVIHLASRTRIPPSWTQYKNYYETNIGASQQLLACAQTMGVKKFIYISSSSVYGNNGTSRQTETDRLCPTNPYAVSKMAAESALRVQADDGDTELVIVRPFTMYGDYMDFGHDALVIGKFLTAWEKDEPLLIEGDGEQRRDFLHASDAVAGLQLIVEQGRNGDIFNLGTGESVSVNQLADVVSQKQIRVPARRGHVEYTEADITRLKQLGYAPKVRVLDWLTQCVDEYKLKEIIR